MDAIGEILVSGRVADETGIILDRLVEQGRYVVNEIVWQAYATKEYQRQPARFLKGSMVNDAWPSVVAYF